MSFHTTNADGLLLFAYHYTYSDFLMLSVVHGKLNFLFNPGGETIKITSLQRVDDGHLVQAVLG